MLGKSKNFFFLEELETTSGIKCFIVLKTFFFLIPSAFSHLSFPSLLAFQQASGQCAALRAMLKEGELFLWKFPAHWNTYGQLSNLTGVVIRTNDLLILSPSPLTFVVTWKPGKPMMNLKSHTTRWYCCPEIFLWWLWTFPASGNPSALLASSLTSTFFQSGRTWEESKRKHLTLLRAFSSQPSNSTQQGTFPSDCRWLEYILPFPLWTFIK